MELWKYVVYSISITTVIIVYRDNDRDHYHDRDNRDFVAIQGLDLSLVNNASLQYYL